MDLNEEERELLESYERGELTSVADPKELERFADVADLKVFEDRASEADIPLEEVVRDLKKRGKI